MTAAEILRNAEPPVDDGLIDKAIAELDVRIWEWADALKSAQTQLRTAFATKPVRPSARLFEDTTSAPSALSAAAAAAHIPSPPPMPSEWTTAASASAPASSAPGMPAEAPWASTHGGHGMSSGTSGPAPQQAWPEPHSRQSNTGSQPSDGGTMTWPAAATNAWPSSPSSTTSSNVQEWPTWTPTDLSKTTEPAKKTQSSAPPKKGAKQARAFPEGPSPEERAQKAAAEEALLSELEDAIARRVRLLRRLDPDTPIEKLIDKARQGQAEATTAPQGKDDKSSSWWRRK
jgi:hypothetical protein